MRIAGLIASLSIAAVISGCGGHGAFSTTPSDQNQDPGNDHGVPTAVVPSSSLDAVVGQALSLDASASLDPDGRALTFAWSVTTHPAADAGTLSRATTATPTFTAHAAGTYVLEVRVTSSDGQRARATVTVTAREPAGLTVITLSSDARDYIGGGRAYRYTRADSRITVSASGGHLSVSISGDQYWSGNFVEPSSLTTLAAGTYSNLTRYPFHDDAVGGLDWSGEGRGCNELTGWFAIDDVTYENGALASVDLRFEQHCEGAAPALRGEIHWTSEDTTAAAGPVDPPPDGLWAPAADATPASGNYVYLESQAGDYIGQGRVYTYAQASTLGVTVSGARVDVSIQVNSATGYDWWNGSFQGMSGLAKLQPGYYGNLERYPFNNPVRGGLSWSGEGRGCNTLTGWFVIDAITYDNGALSAVDLRFEQHCEGSSPALHGQLHWASGGGT